MKITGFTTRTQKKNHQNRSKGIGMLPLVSTTKLGTHWNACITYIRQIWVACISLPFSAIQQKLSAPRADWWNSCANLCSDCSTCTPIWIILSKSCDCITSTKDTKVSTALAPLFLPLKKLCTMESCVKLPGSLGKQCPKHTKCVFLINFHITNAENTYYTIYVTYLEQW